MRLLHFAPIGAIVAILAPGSAYAQSEVVKKDRVLEMARKVGVHLNMSFRDPVDPDVTKGRTFGISMGLSPGRTNGWTFPVGLTMFSEDLHSPNGETFGSMRTVGLMAGVGYGWHFGRLSTGATLQTGYAMNTGHLDGDVTRAFGAPDGVGLHVGNSALLRPQVKAEYFLTQKVTLRVSADYMMLRPDISVTTPTERLSDRWDPTNVHANFGIGYYPFRR
jgi:hypothetical protein